jgi:hypothetical protein
VVVAVVVVIEVGVAAGVPLVEAVGDHLVTVVGEGVAGVPLVEAGVLPGVVAVVRVEAHGGEPANRLSLSRTNTKAFLLPAVKMMC